MVSVLQLGSAERFMQESQFLIYGNGKDKPPTGFMFEKQQMKGLYFNQSPSKVWYSSSLSFPIKQFLWFYQFAESPTSAYVSWKHFWDAIFLGFVTLSTTYR